MYQKEDTPKGTSVTSSHQGKLLPSVLSMEKTICQVAGRQLQKSLKLVFKKKKKKLPSVLGAPGFRCSVPLNKYELKFPCRGLSLKDEVRERRSLLDIAVFMIK